MRKFKGFAAILVMAVMVVGIISGCGNDNTNTDTNTKAETKSATVETKTTEVKETEKSDNVIVWTFPVEKTYKDNFAQLQSDFTAAHKNINIQMEELSWAEGLKKFETALNAGDPPDIMFAVPNAKYVSTGLCVEVDKFLDKSILDDFYPNTLDYMRVENKLYGLPLYLKIHTIGGNKKLLEAAGVDYKKIQKDGWTWDEFKDILKKGTKDVNGKKQYGFVFHGAQTDPWELLFHMCANNGLTNTDTYGIDENGNYIFTDPKFLETLKFIRSLIDEGYMPKESNQITPAKRMEFLYTEGAMIIGKAMPYYEVVIGDNNKKVKEGTAPADQKEVDFVLLPEPHNKGQQPRTIGGADGYSLFKQKNYKGDEHTKNAALVLAALTQGKAGISASVLCLPQVTKSGDELNKDKYTMNAENKEAVNMLAKNVPKKAQISADLEKNAIVIFDQVIKAKYPAVLGGDVTPDEMYQAVKDKAKELFGK